MFIARKQKPQQKINKIQRKKMNLRASMLQLSIIPFFVKSCSVLLVYKNVTLVIRMSQLFHEMKLYKCALKTCMFCRHTMSTHTHAHTHAHIHTRTQIYIYIYGYTHTHQLLTNCGSFDLITICSTLFCEKLDLFRKCNVPAFYKLELHLYTCRCW